MTKDIHIDSVTMALYVQGYRHLKETALRHIHQHIVQCEPCALFFEEKLQEAAWEIENEHLAKMKLWRDVIKGLVNLQGNLLENPAVFDRLRCASKHLIPFLDIPEKLEPSKQDKQWYALLTQGYAYTPAGGGEENNQQAEHAPGSPCGNRLEKECEITEKLGPLMKFFLDERIAVNIRMNLVENFLKEIQKKSLKEINEKPAKE